MEKYLMLHPKTLSCTDILRALTYEMVPFQVVFFPLVTLSEAVRIPFHT